VDPSPTIPTSFVPKQPVKTVTRRPQPGSNLFSISSLVVLGIAVVGCGAVFGYQKFLEGVRDADAAKLQAAEQDISQETVTGFIRTRDRFSAAKDILNAHIAFSQYLDALESTTLQNVRFSNLTFDRDTTGKETIAMSGIARSFNSLAAESALFTNVKELKRAIFSGITVNPKDGSVLFTFTANLDPALIIAHTPSFIPPPQVATTTATGTPAIVPPVVSTTTHATTTKP
jgi:hypothetical protein